MICKYCGASFRKENLRYCPYCDMEISEEINNQNIDAGQDALQENDKVKWNLDKPTEKYDFTDYSQDEIFGTVKITVVGNRNMFSPASGSNYIVKFDDGLCQVRLTKDDYDRFESIKLPVGKHVGALEFYSWSDTELANGETGLNDIFDIEVKENHITEINIKTGTILSSRKIEIVYN